MRTIVSALVALSVLAGASGSALASDYQFPRDFWKHLERNLP